MYAYSAGIIPFNPNLGFLLGKEKHGWAPFSGKSELNETVFGTAVREFHEESCMVFKDVSLSDVKERIENTTPRGKPFHMFVAMFPEIHRSEEFLQARSACSDYSMLEKTEIRWFSPEELRGGSFKFRSCFITEIPRLLSFWSCYVEPRQSPPLQESKGPGPEPEVRPEPGPGPEPVPVPEEGAEPRAPPG